MSSPPPREEHNSHSTPARGETTPETSSHDARIDLAGNSDLSRYEAYHEWSDEVLRPVVAELGEFAPGARAAKTALAVAIAWWLGNLLGEPRPIFAALGALVGVEPTIVGSVRRTALQLVGVMGGIGVATVLTYLSQETRAAVIGLAVLLGLWLGRLFRSPDRVGVELSVTALLVVVLGRGDVAYGFSRLWEIGLGGLIAATVNALILPPSYLGGVIQNLDTLVERVADGLSEAVGIFVERPHHEGAAEARERVRAARTSIPKLESNLRRAAEALRFSPLLTGNGPRLRRARDALKLYNHAASHASRIARIVAQHAERPHSWSHTSHLQSTSHLLETAQALALALKHFQSYVREGTPMPLAESERELKEARAALADFYVAAQMERATTEMERLVDIGAIAAELEHLGVDVDEALVSSTTEA